MSCSSSGGGQNATAEATIESLEQTEVISEPDLLDDILVESTTAATDATPAPTRLPVPSLAGDPEYGRILFDQLGCNGCHKTSGEGGIGPGLGPVWIVSDTRVEGLSAEEYLEQSIRDPMAYIVDDYNPIMPGTFTDLPRHDVDSLVAYLFSLSVQDEVEGDASQVPFIGDVLVEDNFDSRTLTRGSAAGWISKVGEWSAATGTLIETSGADTDNRIVQTLGQREYDINADITWFGGKAGLVYRYRSERDWHMTWVHDNGVEVFSARRIDGEVLVWKVVPLNWGGEGATRNLAIQVRRDSINVYVDGTLISTLIDDSLSSATGAGVFSRGNSLNAADNFVVSGPLPPTPTATATPLVPPTATPTPAPTATPQPAVYQTYGAGPDFDVSQINGPEGTIVEVVVSGGIGNPTSIDFDDEGNLYVTGNSGLNDAEGSVFVIPNATSGTELSAHIFGDGLLRPTGVLHHKTGLLVSNRGSIIRFNDTTGDLVADVRTVIVDGLPAELRDHQTHGLIEGSDGRIYVAQGGTKNCCEDETAELAGTIFSMNPDGSDIKVFSTGHRNPYDIAFNERDHLFSTDNGPNIGDPSLDPNDEFNRVKEGADYGYPWNFGMVDEGTNSENPLILLPKHHAPTGLTLAHENAIPGLNDNDLLLSMWSTGRIRRLVLHYDPIDDRYDVEDLHFATNVGNHPIDVVIGPDGYLYIASFDTGQIWRMRPG